jgi:LacI family transcriptional regulator
MAINALAERGFKHLGYLSFEPSLTMENFGPFLKAEAESRSCMLHLFGIESEGVESGTYSGSEEIIRMIANWLSALPRPLAVIAYNHKMAGRIVSACQMADIAIPEELALITHGNRRIFCETCPIPLSAVDTNPTEKARQAILLLKRLWEGEDVPKEPKLIPPAGIVERRSTDILAVSDARVAMAIRYIWDNLDRPLHVDEIAYKSADVSRSTLERRFQRSLRRSVNAEIRRKRMEECKRLLKSTDMTIAEIAKAIGLKSRRYLHQSFKDSFGITPEAFRNSAL